MTIEDVVVRELGLRIILEDKQGDENFAFIRTLPHNYENLIYGLLFSSRIISSPSDILHLEVQNQLARVRLAEACNLHEKFVQLRPTARLVSGVCGPEESMVGVWQACDLPPIESKIKLSPEIIRNAIQGLNHQMTLFRQTGGTHGAGLGDENGDLLCLSEDVGRHNAIDRVIGKALIQNHALSSSLLVCSGRLTADLVLKVAVARIPFLASISTAISSGIELADAAGITLIGFVRGSQMNVYTHSERLVIT